MRPKEEKILKWGLGVLLAASGCFLLGFFFYDNLLSPEAREARRFIKQMPAAQIQTVALEPIPYDPKPLITKSVTISDRAMIGKIGELVHAGRRCSPNHPEEKWALLLRFLLKDREFVGQVLSTSNQGVLFYYGYDPSGGANYGTYRQDALGPLLEAVVAQHTDH